MESNAKYSFEMEVRLNLERRLNKLTFLFLVQTQLPIYKSCSNVKIGHKSKKNITLNISKRYTNFLQNSRIKEYEGNVSDQFLKCIWNTSHMAY